MTSARAQTLMTLAGAMGTVFMLGCLNPMDSGSKDGSLAMSQASDPEAEAGTGKTDICHIPPGNPANARTLSVGNPAVPAHLAHGDKIGRCEDKHPGKPKPCADKAPQSKEHDGMAPAPRNGKAAVCHIPPGNPSNAHTILVGVAAVKAHLAHGDLLGACAVESESIASDCDGPGHGNGHTDGGSGTETGTDPIPTPSSEKN